MASIEKSPRVDMAKLEAEVTEVSRVGVTAEAVMRDMSLQLKRSKRWGLS